MNADRLRIDCRDVSKRFVIPVAGQTTLRERFSGIFQPRPMRTFEALQGISFCLREGELLGIVGHNGSGKTTLMKVLCGIYSADRGRVQVSGRIAPLLALGIGFNGELSGRDNAVINARLLGVPARTIRRNLEGLFAYAGLTGFEGMKMKNYSSGMWSRLAFSVASCVDADIYIMDDVLAVGDRQFQALCLERLEALKAANKTIILVSHDLGAVQQHCSRALWIDHGRMLFDGAPKECCERYLSLAAQS